MKKIFILMALILIQQLLVAQQSQQDSLPVMGTENAIDRVGIMKHLNARTHKGEAVGWLIPSWNLLDYFYQNSVAVTHYANLIMPDSTVRYESSGTIQHHWLMGVGGVLDPYSPMFDSLQSVSPIETGKDYSLDSIFVLGWYNMVNSGPDTLIAEIVYGQATYSPEFAHTIFNFTPDTFHMSPPRVYGDPAQFGYLCRMTAPSKHVYKYVLSASDSTNNFGKYITIPVGLYIPAGNVVGLSLSFVPGQPYGFGDMGYSYSHTETQTVNSFRVGLYSTDDVNTDPHVFVDPYEGYSATNYLRKEIRYTMYTSPNTWRNERMTCSVSWAFDIGYYVSKDSLSSVQEGEATVSGVFPNPVTGGIINIISPDNIPLEIIITACNGQQVFAEMAYERNKALDISMLRPGIYFMRIVQGASVITKKIIVQ